MLPKLLGRPGQPDPSRRIRAARRHHSTSFPGLNRPIFVYTHRGAAVRHRHKVCSNAPYHRAFLCVSEVVQ